MSKTIVYCLYNLFFEVSVLFSLLFANTFVNDLLIPRGVQWLNGSPRNDSKSLGISAAIKTAALIIEGAVFIALIYLINKILGDYFFEKDKSNKVMKQTLRINIVISGIFVVILIFGSYRGFLW